MDSENEDDNFEEVKGLDDSEDEEVDDRQHGKLLQAVGSLDGKRYKAPLRSEATSTISEFHIGTTNDGSKVKLHELVGSLKQTTSHGGLKQQLSSVERSAKVLSAPLSKVEAERLERSVAYESTKKEVSKWEPIVEKNRKAEQLIFPLGKPALKFQTADQLVQKFTPHTSLEVEVAAILQGSKHNLPKERLLTEAEERALRAMNLEEAKERRAELQKHRALLSYKEAKAKRQKKIKSKKFHRVLKKDKKKKESKALEELEKTDPEAYMEKLEHIDKDRMKERMSLKHRVGGKFMQNQLIYSKYNKEARQSVMDMLQHNKQLTKKSAAAESESEEDSEDEAMVSEDEEEDKAKPQRDNQSKVVRNPWMAPSKMPKPKNTNPAPISTPKDSDGKEIDGGESKTLDHDEGVEEEKDGEESETSEDGEGVEEGIVPNIDELFEVLEKKPAQSKSENSIAEEPRKKQHKRKERKKKKLKSQQQEDESGEESELSESDESDEEGEVKKEEVKTKRSKKTVEEEEDSALSESLSRKRVLEDMNTEDWSDEETTEKTKRRVKTDTKAAAKNNNSNTKEEVAIDPKKVLVMETSIKSASLPTLAEGEEDTEVDLEEQQRLTIAQAFADDDVLEDFAKEKKEIEDRDKPKDIDLTLPGWGDWGGAGLKVSKKKRSKFLIKAPPAPPRQDRTLGNVIISETKDTSITKHQVSDLPFPFTRPDQFEKSMRAPLGKHWNTETSYRKLIEPKVITKLGTVIDPIDKTEAFKKEKIIGKRKGPGIQEINPKKLKGKRAK